MTNTLKTLEEVEARINNSIVIYETVYNGPGAIDVQLQARNHDADHNETWAEKGQRIPFDYSLNSLENHQYAVAEVASVEPKHVNLGGENAKGFLWIVTKD
jgi:hypothetical protein